MGKPNVVAIGLSGWQSGQDEGVGDVLAVGPVKLQQAVQILEELVYQDGRGLPEGAGQELCLEQALVAQLRRD